MKKLGLMGLLGAALLGGAAGVAHAAPTLRLQVDQKGDFVLIGNTLGHECSTTGTPAVPAPVVGTVGACGSNLTDTAPDVFWRADAPGAGQAQANSAITVAQARSTAVLALPPGATVTHAYLYWGAATGTNNADTTVTLERPGVFMNDVTAIASVTNSGAYYQSVADITAVVQANGVGPYRVSGVTAANFVNAAVDTNFAGWWMVVLYQLPAAPLRNLAIFDGLDGVSNGAPQNANLSGFLVPAAGYDARLGIVTFEGDATITGDGFFFNGGAALTDAQNPANNFFNGTRSLLGAPVSVPGDLPQLTGTARSMSGMDLDVVDITNKVMPLQTSAPISATSTGDVYFLAGFVTSISTFKPDFTSSTKSAVDVNGPPLLPNDVIQYTINVVNNGNDTSINTVLTDVIPAGVTYVPGSIAITQGANMGPKTDAPGDDQANFGAGTVTVRLGAGANATQGGTMLVGETATVTFQVTVNPNASGTISNQAIINAGGQQGAPAEDTPTDGNGPAGGSPPTDVVVEQCVTDAECSPPTPFCNVAANPNVCVECLVDAQCAQPTPVCDPVTNTCICVPTGAEVCDGIDNDCNGAVDDGDPGGGVGCSTGQPGVCDAGLTACAAGMIVCNAVITPGTQTETCNMLDDDCDASTDEGFNLGAPCTVGLGACQNTGVTVCSPSGVATCSVEPGAAEPEMCGDLIDQDCDGIVNNDCDSDMDGILDPDEIDAGTNPLDADSDDDGVTDGTEPSWDVDSDGDGLINALDPDSDNDGLYDGTELGLGCGGPGTDVGAGHCVPDGDGGATTTDPLDADTDDGSVPDGAEDTNLNGVIDPGETDPNDPADDVPPTDTDGDGLPDVFEETIGSDPNDADTDDDGVIDGDEQNPADDTDGDGLINVLDVDSDNDGLYDGTELGLDCSNPATDVTLGHCIEDADGGATTTSPVDPDTDDGGVPDGQEDIDLDGEIDAGETDPNDPSDDVPLQDSDGDGLPDVVEIEVGSDPNDADSDDDGVIDGQEPNYSDDHDGDGLINVLDPDSDGDGLFDGTELGLDCGAPGTDPGAGNCIPDADGGATTTNPLDADTDDGGVPDGTEDADHDGEIDPGEGDPNDPSDDVPGDSDGDGIPDDVEIEIGTDPNDGDSDDDGVIDGDEPDFDQDTDGDGLINALDPDSDDDGIFDGTELGLDCGGPDTDETVGNCVPDGDGGATTTDPLDPDTDGGGIPDGEEDANHNGVIDQGEGDPNDPADDGCSQDSDCPDGQICDVSQGTPGTCRATATDPDDIFAEGNGIFCAAQPARGGRNADALFVLLGVLGGLALRRRRRAA